MGLNVARGFLNTTTNAAGNTVVVNTLGFQPKVIFFWWNGRVDTTDAVGRRTQQTGFGYAVSTTDRRYATCLSQDTPTSMVTNRMQGNAACIGITTTADAIDGLMDLQSMDSGGFTLVIDDAFTASYTIHYLALGGSDIVSVAGNNFTMATVTGNQDVEQVSFLPNFIFFFSSGQQTINDSVSVDATLTLGAAKSSSNRYTYVGGSNDGAGNAQTMSYCYDGECIAFLDSAITATESRADFVNFHSSPANGFRINWLENAVTTKIISYVAIQFTNDSYVVLGDLLTRTDGNDIVESGFPHLPLGGMFISHCKAKSTQDTAQDDFELSIGAFNSASSRSAIGMMDDDAAATAVVGTAIEFDEVYINLPNTAASVEGLMDIKSVDATGFTAVMDDTDPSAAFVWYATFGLEILTVNLGTIASDSSVPNLTVNSVVTLGHVTSDSTLFNADFTVEGNEIALGFIASTSDVPNQTFNSVIAIAHIADADSLFDPTFTSTITLAHIGSDSALFNPTLQSSIALGHVASDSQLFNAAYTLNILLGTVASDSQLFNPTLQSTITLGFIGSTSALFDSSFTASSGGLEIFLGHIPSASDVFTPSFQYTITLAHVPSDSTLYNVTFVSSLALGHIPSDSLVHNLQVNSGIVLGHISSTSVLFNLDFKYTIALGFIASTSLVFSGNVFPLTNEQIYAYLIAIHDGRYAILIDSARNTIDIHDERSSITIEDGRSSAYAGSDI